MEVSCHKLPLKEVSRHSRKRLSGAEKKVKKEKEKSAVKRAIPPATFSRVVREVAGDEDIKYGKDAMKMLQTVVEDRFIKLCASGYACSKHAGRETLKKEDILLVLSLGK
jgi:histone H3/H4